MTDEEYEFEAIPLKPTRTVKMRFIKEKAMSNEDITAFMNHWTDHNDPITTGSAAYFHARNAYLAALAHRDKQVVELVQAVEAINGHRYMMDSAFSKGATEHVDIAVKLAAKLKEQHNDRFN